MIRSERVFALDRAWLAICSELSLEPRDLLRVAGLPSGLLLGPEPALPAEEFYRLWNALDRLAGQPDLAVRILESGALARFSPPIYAALCCQNLSQALERLIQFKPLLGPLSLHVQEDADRLVARIELAPAAIEPAPSLIHLEIAYLAKLARIATGFPVVPELAQLPQPAPPGSRLTEFLGIEPKPGRRCLIAFRAEDARRPFLAASERMWEALAAELSLQTLSLGCSGGLAEQVRGVLRGIVAGGEASIAVVAGQLGISARTLQRRLAAEGLTFADLLAALRRELADEYLRRTDFTSTEIALLLGYRDPNSFIRAYQKWTGLGPSAARREMAGRRA